MNDVWNLDPIYKGFDDPAFEADFAAASERISRFSSLTASLSNASAPDALREGIILLEEISALSQKLGMYASLRQYANSRDTEAQSQMGRLMNLFSAAAATNAFASIASPR